MADTKSAVKPLMDELKSWLPTAAKNQDYEAALVRYQIYKVLGELADKAATDEGLLAALKGWQGLLKSYLTKESFLVDKANAKRLPPAQSEPYVRAAFALKETLDKITALRAAKP